MPTRRDRYGDLSDLSLRFARQKDFEASEACGLRALLLPTIGRGHSFHSDGASLTGFGADKSDQLRSTGTGEVNAIVESLDHQKAELVYGLDMYPTASAWRIRNVEGRKSFPHTSTDQKHRSDSNKHLHYCSR